MATERLPMHKAREILRLKWTAARRHRQIARALRVGVGTVSAALERCTLIASQPEHEPVCMEHEPAICVGGAR